MKNQQISLELPRDWKLKLDSLAKKRGTNTSQLIRDAIWMWLGHERYR
jgi:metal-responsive CopG/Arc/MetJ family transcriptional regulator